MNPWIIKGLIVGLCTLGGMATSLIFKMKKDNPIEEYAEKIIEEQTGFLIDLSPQDDEDPDNKN